MPDTILVVEDDEGVLMLTSLVLRSAGYRVLEARDGPDAIALGERAGDNLRLLVVDVVLPSMAGTKVAERLLADRPEMRVLYFSGYSRDAMPADRAIGLNDPLLEKPFTPKMLLAKVQEALVR